MLTGGPTQIDAAVSQPLAWSLVNNYTALPATEDLLGYSTFATATTETIFLQGVSTSGVASRFSLQRSQTEHGGRSATARIYGAFNFDFYSKTGASGAGLYYETFDPTTGRIGRPDRLSVDARFTTVSSEASTQLSDGDKLRFVEGFQGSQQVIQDFLGSSTTPITTSTWGAQRRITIATTTVTDPNDGATDYTVLAYSDNNQVHLELLNNYGDRIGSDLVVPGITSFDKLHTLFNTANDDYRVELDYTVADPKGGTQVEGIIYDTSPTGDLHHVERRRRVCRHAVRRYLHRRAGKLYDQWRRRSGYLPDQPDLEPGPLFTQFFATTRGFNLQQHGPDFGKFDWDDDAQGLHSYQPQ